ncbi:unnamed protein product [Staurois parvus]|uniref:Pectinesterase n=1 Tax=Staurois parvus TaxID=386267 RepID=A0ABN9GXP4_9NEOB|nr:unnamed protein product [Staurois parvus]
MQGPGRADIVNAGSGESGYSECRVRGERIYAGSGETSSYIVSAGSGETSYSECRVRGDQL